MRFGDTAELPAACMLKHHEILCLARYTIVKTCRTSRLKMGGHKFQGGSSRLMASSQFWNKGVKGMHPSFAAFLGRGCPGADLEGRTGSCTPAVVEERGCAGMGRERSRKDSRVQELWWQPLQVTVEASWPPKVCST